MQRFFLIAAISAATLGLTGCDKGEPSTPPVRELPKPTAPPHVPTTPPTPAAPATQAADAAPTNVKCPVSGDNVDPKDPKAPLVTYNGKAYALCCKDCIKDFNANPAKYVKAE